MLGLSRARQNRGYEDQEKKNKMTTTTMRRIEGIFKGWMVHIQSSTCRAWTKHFANLSKTILCRQMWASINDDDEKGLVFGDLIRWAIFWAKFNKWTGEMLCFKLFITCRLGMMVKEEFVWLDGVGHVHTLYSAGWWGHSKARLVGYGAMQWQARANI